MNVINFLDGIIFLLLGSFFCNNYGTAPYRSLHDVLKNSYDNF